jgi:hypothetical protein
MNGNARKGNQGIRPYKVPVDENQHLFCNA